MATTSLAATGGTTPIHSRKGALAVRGTFTGTVVLQADIDGDTNFSTAVDPATGDAYELSAAGMLTYDLGKACLVRAYFTRTDGTAVVTLS
jgi:hypothetical protein